MCGCCVYCVAAVCTLYLLCALCGCYVHYVGAVCTVWVPSTLIEWVLYACGCYVHFVVAVCTVWLLCALCGCCVHCVGAAFTTYPSSNMQWDTSLSLFIKIICSMLYTCFETLEKRR